MTKVLNAPTEIWLNYGDDDDGDYLHNECGGISWSEFRPATAVNVRYVRADLHEALQAQLAEANAEGDEIVIAVNDLTAALTKTQQQLSALHAENERLSALVPRWIPVGRGLPAAQKAYRVYHEKKGITFAVFNESTNTPPWGSIDSPWWITHWLEDNVTEPPLSSPAPSDQQPQAGEQENV